MHDFALSCAIHMAGATCALTGAKILGPRIVKFDYDKAGKVTKVNAIPGHNIAIGCPGFFHSLVWLVRLQWC